MTETGTLTLTDFLLARIAEDEQEASAADEQRLWRVSQADDRIIADAGYMQQFMPSRMLAECEAKRRIVELHPVGEHPCPGKPVEWIGYKANEPFESWICATLAALALLYADHPDYRDEWRL